MSAQPRSFGHPRKLASTAIASCVGALAFCLPASSHAGNLACDVAIIGGGPGGLHTAYKLTTQHLTAGPVCLFEKSDHLGGRVGDNFNVGFAGKPFVSKGVAVKGSGQTGTGGYRMYQNQYTHKLGLELAALGQPGQLTFLAQNSFSRLAAVKNDGLNPSFTGSKYFTYNNGGVAKAFAPLYNSPINDNDMWKVLLCGPQVITDGNHVPQYGQMAIPGLGNMSTFDYLEWVAANVISPAHGPDVAQYMLDVWRFRGDFDSPNDAVSYLEYNAKDFTGGTVYYPIPSFQPYFEIMAAQTTGAGGQIFLNEKVVSVNTQSSGPRYVLVTANNTVTANKVIIATTHTALQSNAPNAPPGGITGNVINMIVSQPQFQFVQSTNAVTVTHQFGDGATSNSGWWHNDITYPTGPSLLGPQLAQSADPIRRSSNNILINGDVLPGCNSSTCDFTQIGFFNNTNELPLTDYHDFINVSRSVYNDQHDAVENWIALYDAGEALAPNGGGNAAINRQILKSLRLMYPKVFTGNPANEPPILATKFTVHKPAWYNLKKGAYAGSITNDSLFAWSLKPIQGEKVYMVGDAWRTDLSGWSEAAYKGSVYVLNNYFGAKIDPKEEATIECVNGEIVDPS
jgi:NAD(P)-binding Rossmann-like domain